uniref:Uncharacterized protein n=1 Tax=Mucochytrium quahogii TaxID=96639 RepID=A0A7S2SP87_9STRA|mmetsp:Transcript_19105/g.31302  ORF Transcript_19105/g.31302 Transcript_19105/m.31302 type:complete len:217 (+) Transcript_19105:159-809(+)|eukprot:CAMPEP_0203749796 /NCGR_PEP_ID=MMETSP0098-20131031/4208_1 /ASSEMBLY_ACC=CAM_ASM_000208 /TAXON_ID=96639 /ORGANISM=" , Strain NY0313808BC1" /LENGTH=216 /DNA_ID=CAMNT_0050638899 /DNA_START=128 /DNA_END=778 /DNA_ORIENTATION=+
MDPEHAFFDCLLMLLVFMSTFGVVGVMFPKIFLHEVQMEAVSYSPYGFVSSYAFQMSKAMPFLITFCAMYMGLRYIESQNSMLQDRKKRRARINSTLKAMMQEIKLNVKLCPFNVPRFYNRETPPLPKAEKARTRNKKIETSLSEMMKTVQTNLKVHKQETLPPRLPPRPPLKQRPAMPHKVSFKARKEVIRDKAPFVRPPTPINLTSRVDLVDKS